jgi:hypothetical protein
MELRNDVDETDDVSIEVWQILRWNPQLAMHRGAHRLHRIARQESAGDPEPRNETGPGLPHVPLACDLSRILLVQHRVENWLTRQAWRKGSISAVRDERELLRAHRAEESGRVRVCVRHLPDVSV